MWARLRDWVADPNTAASCPGRFPVDFIELVRCFPRWPLIIAAVLVVSGLLAATVHWGFWILTLLTLGFVASLAYGIADHYCNGCANPARIVSLDPDLIAVHADLTTGDRPAHVIKILPQPLRRLRGEPLAVGNRLATVALYGGDTHGVRWDDFDPMLTNCASRDAKELRRLRERISPAYWAELDAGLAQIPTPYAPGLYRVDLETLRTGDGSGV